MTRPTIIFGTLAVIFSFSSAFPYIFGLAKKHTRPHFISWLIWSLTTGTAFFAQVFSHAGAGAWNTGLAFIQNVILAIYGYFYGEKNITRSDWMSLLIVLGAIPLWIATHNPLYSVVLVTLIDVIGYYPTIRKSWHKPYDEPPLAYTFGSVGLFLSILALDLEDFSPSNWIYPALCFAANTSLVLVLTLRRRVISKPINSPL